MSIMQAHERAAQIWPVLSLAALNRQILTYRILGKLIGVPARGLGHLLEPIQSYCKIRELPALTALVVRKTGLPGIGFTGAQDVPLEQNRVFAHNWLEEATPTPEQLRAAAIECPSCGVQDTPDEDE